ncbi:MAG: VCBS repeat-containing protein [Acidobacteria bacterium]|nr:MAG: VCBS repeat-containing protein [Acidobacteriota bacterium]
MSFEREPSPVRRTHFPLSHQGAPVRARRSTRLLKPGVTLTALLAVTLIPWHGLRPRAAGSGEINFRKHTIDLGPSETCAVADLNQDGKLDIISGENWYEQRSAGAAGAGPEWVKHKFRSLDYREYYVDDFSDLPIDVNGDGYPDLVTATWFTNRLSWYENPRGREAPWRETVIQSGYPVEFAFLVDLLNTGKPQQLLPQFGDEKAPLAWYELTGTGAEAQWVKHEVSPQSYGHGIGAGDVNGDGRTDILTPKGWFEAPPDPRNGRWIFHPEFDLGVTGFIYAEDVNGDGLPDLVTSAAHGYGIFWYEQRKNSSGQRSWIKHVVDDSWSQSHALTLVDLNRDGRRDLVTGKRFMAHNGRDPGEREPLGVYWYESSNVEGRPEWVRHIIDYSTRAGGGMQIPVVDIDGDGDLDVVVAGKSGLFLFENLTISH